MKHPFYHQDGYQVCENLKTCTNNVNNNSLTEITHILLYFKTSCKQGFNSILALNFSERERENEIQREPK
jgi:tRNA A37 N6-isopentenylltransferase MiaA